MDLSICIKEIEDLYQKTFVIKQNFPNTFFISYFETLENIEVIKVVDEELSKVNIKPNNQLKRDELRVLSEIKQHYTLLENKYKTLTKEAQELKSKQFQNFVAKVAENPKMFPSFDFKSAYNVICPSPPKPGQGPSQGGKEPTKKKQPAKKKVTSKKKKCKA